MPSNSSSAQIDAAVVANTKLCDEHYRLTLDVSGLPESFAGQFVQVLCRDVHDPLFDNTFDAGFASDVEMDWTPGQKLELANDDLHERHALLRRPFSIAGRRGNHIDLIQRTVGPGTNYLAGLKPGDVVSVIGPLGNRFKLPPAGGIALFVGGGVGIPPMIYLSQVLRSANQNHKSVAFCGATTRRLLALTVTNNAPAPKIDAIDPLYNIAEFDQFGTPAVITTDDGSFGYKGFVTDALAQYLDRYITDNADRMRTVIYTCGPEGMMKRVQEIAARRSVACQIAVERAMACGMGTCQSCCVRIKKPDPSKPPLAGKEWCYRLACTDGPVFTGDELMW
jgi:dihydroorotate dehydrogenase electron transfer subunit